MNNTRTKTIQICENNICTNYNEVPKSNTPASVFIVFAMICIILPMVIFGIYVKLDRDKYDV